MHEMFSPSAATVVRRCRLSVLRWRLLAKFGIPPQGSRFNRPLDEIISHRFQTLSPR